VQLSRITFHHLSNAQFTRVAPFSAMGCSVVCCDVRQLRSRWSLFLLNVLIFPAKAFSTCLSADALGAPNGAKRLSEKSFSAEGRSVMLYYVQIWSDKRIGVKELTTP